MPLLFCYGTLQLPQVQFATFGRELSGTPDSLVGYAQSTVAVGDPDVVRASGKKHHPIVIYTGDENHRVTGTVFEITEHELHLADRYEISVYKRIATSTALGRRAWAYVDAMSTRPA